MSELKRQLSLLDAISVVAGSMIGCGIFIVSADIARQVNSASLLIIVWIFAGIVTLCGSLCYGELASTIPAEGGQYIYLKEIFNEKIAFLYGWTLFFVIQSGTIAAVNVAFAKFLGLIFNFISPDNFLFNMPFSTQQLCAILSVLLITFINSRGIKHGVITQNIFTVTKILSMVLIITCGLFLGLNQEVLKLNFAPVANQIVLNLDTLKVVAVAIVGALFASITWNNITFITSEIKNPKRNIPRALIIGTMTVIILYLFTNFIYLGVMPLNMIKTASQDIVAAQLIYQIFGNTATILISVIIAISAFGCANGMILTGSRIYYKMAKDRLFFRGLATINRRTKVPTNSLWAQCGWICLLILWGNYSQLLDFVIYASLIFYVLTIFGMFKMRKMYKNKLSSAEKENIYKVNTAIPVIFLILSGFIIICLTVYKPNYTLPGIFITLFGFVFYPFFKKSKNRR